MKIRSHSSYSIFALRTWRYDYFAIRSKTHLTIFWILYCTYLPTWTGETIDNSWEDFALSQFFVSKYRGAICLGKGLFFYNLNRYCNGFSITFPVRGPPAPCAGHCSRLKLLFWSFGRRRSNKRKIVCCKQLCKKGP